LFLVVGATEGEPLTFATNERQDILVTIRPLTIDEKQKLKGKFLVCTAFTKAEPSTDVHTMFEGLAYNLMPQENQEKEQWTRKQLMRSLDLFPRQFQEFVSAVHHRLAESIRLTARVIRSRWAIKSSYRPIHSTWGVSWSFDGQDWRKMPYTMFGDAKAHAEMERLIKAGENEPLGMSCFLRRGGFGAIIREARGLLVCAAEVGLK
jgi:hypothetical protein